MRKGEITITDKNDVIKVAKKALRMLGDTEKSHLWDCQQDEHAFLASDAARILKKTQTWQDLKKVQLKLSKIDECESDHHWDTASSIMDFIEQKLPITMRAKPKPKKESWLEAEIRFRQEAFGSIGLKTTIAGTPIYN